METPSEAPARQAEFPEKLMFLFEPHRYKVLHGGRGSGKSWGAARALLILGRNHKLRILCAREIWKSIEESFYADLCEQVFRLGMGSPAGSVVTVVEWVKEKDANGNERNDVPRIPVEVKVVQDGFYHFTKRHIVGANRTLFMFAGLWMNIDSIKSMSSIDICCIEEAHKVSKDSWRKLIPTIRKEGIAIYSDALVDKSEIWVLFNPELEEDETYQRFVVHKDLLKDAVVMEVNHRENPWFTSVLHDEMKSDMERDYDEYLHIWEGKTKQFLEGSVYAKEMRAAQEEGRITSLDYVRQLPVHCFWDLGWADMTSIWFAQKVGTRYNLIDFWQGRKTTIEDDLKMIQDKGYVMGSYYLPHDAEHGHKASGGMSIEQIIRNAGKTVRVLPRWNMAQGINATRTIFPQCWFDQEKCSDGLTALRRYKFGIDEKTGKWSGVPEHDINSHAADAFRYFAVSITGVDKPVHKIPETVHRTPSRHGWLGR